MAHLLDIGTWTPIIGVNLTDVIFPHIVHGFRGINLPIATYHVGKRFQFSNLLFYKKNILLLKNIEFHIFKKLIFLKTFTRNFFVTLKL